MKVGRPATQARETLEAQVVPATHAGPGAQAVPAAEAGREAQAGPPAPARFVDVRRRRVLRGVLRRGVLRPPIGPRILIAARAGLVIATGRAREMGPVPAGRRRPAGLRALISRRVLAAGRVQRALDAMTEAKRVKVERKAVVGRR
jgi:hypothetical protein